MDAAGFWYLIVIYAQLFSIVLVILSKNDDLVIPNETKVPMIL